MKRFRLWLRRWLYADAPEPSKIVSQAFAEELQRSRRETRLAEENRTLRDIVSDSRTDKTAALDRYMEFAGEWVEARLMAGPGPGMSAAKLRSEAGKVLVAIRERALGLGESQPISAQGAFGDIELALQNVEWRREINLSWLEFSRWGIQQIILISRLNYIKNPLIRAATNVASVYVHGRGVEVTTDDPDANEVLKDFFERNKATFGQDALLKSERRKYYDGNLFWCFFTDTDNTGEVNARLIDATEIQEVVNNPEDDSQPWLYRRVWVSKQFDMVSGIIANKSFEEWYPALGYDPPAKPPTISQHIVNWDKPILHRKCGEVAQWHMGCPIMYPALDWAKEARRLLEACATIRRSLAQFSMTLTTKGGQAALANAKQQLQTTVNAQPGNSLWDTNPTAVNASVFASGPGTTLAAFNTKGAGGDPDDVKWYIAMVAMCFGIPVTWLGKLETANLATATTLDRPTELGFLEKQEAWVEDLTTISKLVLQASANAPKGKLIEAKRAQKLDGVRIMETRRVMTKTGKRVYEAVVAKPGDVNIRVNFPAIREGDLPALVNAIVAAMTLDNKGGQVVGIDEKAGVRLLMDLLAGEFNIDDIDELLDEMYPDRATGVKGTPGYEPAYDPSRTKVPLPPPIGKALPAPGGLPQNPGGLQPQTPGGLSGPGPQDKPVTAVATEALARLLDNLERLREARKGAAA